MGTATTATRRRGRPVEFSREEAIERVVALFWERGYEATSIADLLAATGLSKSSLYNAFGSKDELFRLALERYVERYIDSFAAVIAQGGSLADLHAAVDEMARRLETPAGRMGCMAMNTSTELGMRAAPELMEVSARNRTAFREAFREVLGRAAAVGEVDADRVDDHTEALLALFLTAALATRGGADRDERGGIVRAAHALLEGARRG